MRRVQPARRRPLPIDVFCHASLHAHRVWDLAQAPCRHFARVSRRVLLLRCVSLFLQVREGRARRGRVERLRCFCFAFIAASPHLLGFRFGRGHLWRGLPLNAHLSFGLVALVRLLMLLLIFVARNTYAQVSLDASSLLYRRVFQRDLTAIVGDHDHNMLGQVLSALALQQNVVDILFLNCDFESLVLLL